MHDLPEEARRSIAGNVRQWSKVNAEYGNRDAARSWADETITWGQFGVPDSSIGSPLGEIAGLDVLELGCGTAYFSAWLAKRGARPVALDPTPAQLETARRLQTETGIRFPLVEGVGEVLPFTDATFDLVFSEYGASLWADPERWVPEAARVLRPRGRLVFLTASLLAYLCAPDVGQVTAQLQRPQFGMGRITWPGEEGTEYNLAHGDWIRHLHRHGFEVEDLIELQVPEGAETHPYYDFISADWGRQWPAEEIWVARLHA